MTLRKLIEHSANVAEKWIASEGDPGVTFVCTDSTGKVTVITLSDFEKNQANYLALLRVFCGVFDVKAYAISLIGDSPDPRVCDLNSAMLMVIGCSREEKLIRVRRFSKTMPPVFEEPILEAALAGDFSNLFPSKPPAPEHRAILRDLWDNHYRPMLGTAWVDPAIARN